MNEDEQVEEESIFEMMRTLDEQELEDFKNRV